MLEQGTHIDTNTSTRILCVPLHKEGKVSLINQQKNGTPTFLRDISTGVWAVKLYFALACPSDCKAAALAASIDVTI